MKNDTRAQSAVATVSLFLGKRLLAGLAAAVVLFGVETADAANIWDGGGTNNNWSTATNWDNNVVPSAGAVLHFAGTVRLTPTNNLAAGTSFPGIYFDSGAGSFSLRGNSITMSSVIENNSTNAQQVALPIILSTGSTVALRTILGSGDLTLSGVISGPGSLEKQVQAVNATTAILSGDNTYSGKTTILAGNLSISSIKPIGSASPSSLGKPTAGNSSIPMGTTATLIYTGAGDTTDRELELTGNPCTLDQSGAGLLTFSGNVTPTVSGAKRLYLVGSGAGTGVIAGVIANPPTSGNLRLIKDGSGRWILAGANTYAGSTTIDAGTLALSSSGSLSSSSSVVIAAGGTFDVSAKSSPYTWGSSASLDASGTGTALGTTAAALQGASGGTVDLGTRPVNLTFTPTSFSGDLGHPSLYVADGSLSLGGNLFTVINASGTPLGAGTYRLIEQAAGSVTSLGSNTVAVTGSGVGAGLTPSILVVGGYVNLQVRETPSVSTLPTASNITYGQSLTNSSLTGGVMTNAAGAVVPGTFVFTFPTNAPNAGTAPQSVTFIPTDTSLYESVTFNVSVTVDKAIPIIAPPPVASDIIFGQALSDSILSGGTGSVAGAFAFTSPGDTPDVGAAAQSVTFTPTDTANYESVVINVSVTVNEILMWISSIRAEGSDVVVGWPGTNTLSYSVQSTTSLVPLVPWADLAGHTNLPGVTGAMAATNLNAIDEVRFYRIRMTK